MTVKTDRCGRGLFFVQIKILDHEKQTYNRRGNLYIDILKWYESLALLIVRIATCEFMD